VVLNTHLTSRLYSRLGTAKKISKIPNERKFNGSQTQKINSRNYFRTETPWWSVTGD
jgi:hypothetical protein